MTIKSKSNYSIIEQEAGVHIGQWVKTASGVVGIVRAINDLYRDLPAGGRERTGQIRVHVLVPSDHGSETVRCDSTEVTPATSPAPWVGMDATLCYPNDRYPYEVVSVSKSGRGIGVRELKRLATEDGYAVASNPEAPIEDYSYRRNGRWCKVGQSMNASGLQLGVADFYQDPHV